MPLSALLLSVGESNCLIAVGTDWNRVSVPTRAVTPHEFLDTGQYAAGTSTFVAPPWCSTGCAQRSHRDRGRHRRYGLIRVELKQTGPPATRGVCMRAEYQGTRN